MNASSTTDFTAAGEAQGRWWTREADGRILCQLCPRACRLKEGDRGFCFVRVNRNDQMVLDTYGRSTGFCIDPIEKKPLNHFLPGTPVLSFGTAGCNLGCKFCQNWDISKSREVARLSDRAMPEDIGLAAKKTGCRSVAFTYNDPVIWAEYALDTAAACRAVGLKSVAVTAGYITPEAREEFYAGMDAANIDLKAFTEDFYFKLTSAHLDPVLDTIRYVVNETDCWVELTNLIIPHANDNDDEFRRMCDWILQNVGPDVPVHFTAFHPDFRMRDRGPTPHETLLAAHDVARQTGLNYAYVGNVHDVARQSTYCPKCGELLIERDWYQLGRYALNGNRCGHCGYEVAGCFESQPGTWGPQRQPIRIGSNASQLPIAELSTGTDSTKEGSPMDSAPTDQLSDRFTDDHLRSIHQVACHYVSAVVQNLSYDVAAALEDLAAHTVAGLYVTLKRGETLRGCCGVQGVAIPLAQALAEAAARTAQHDPRMAPIAPPELPHLDVCISILGPPRPIDAIGDDRASAVEIGKHGLRIRMGRNIGLLLPVVATERSWDARQFLDAVCTKASLPPGSWRHEEAVVEVFEGISHTSEMDMLQSAAAADVAVYSSDQLQRLRSWVVYNLSALETGATPFYYAQDVPDASVSGVVLSVQFSPEQPAVSWMQLNVRERIPLQTGLFQLTQNAASALASAGPSQNWKVDVAVLSTVIHHGFDSVYDLRDFDPSSRAMMLMDGRSWSFGFDQSADAEELYQATLDAESFRSGATMVYSTVCDATCSKLSVSSGPRASTKVSSRAPAVAGAFYPADDEAREQQVDQLLAGLEPVEKKPVAAAMVPHAGLRFSGRIAADVWRRIELPSRVLIIGPKHTVDGVDWAVAPHDNWRLSDSASMAGDVELATQIAEAVPGMELDAAAHKNEHGIEVQLPLLYRFAPETRIAAIAMSGATIERLKESAKALAKCLQEMDDPPLLVISSDMNHFADDEENRRRDRMALDVMSKNDPEGLLATCAKENISMCGQIPAALVLMTLQEMGQSVHYTEIAYGTSGDVSGDRSRVVGYAGVLL